MTQLIKEPTTEQQIATTIMAQMGGGNKLRTMLGIKQFVSLGQEEGQEGGLYFQFKGSRKANVVEVILTPMDTKDRRIAW
jgi:hypothetical protein